MLVLFRAQLNVHVYIYIYIYIYGWLHKRQDLLRKKGEVFVRSNMGPLLLSFSQLLAWWHRKGSWYNVQMTRLPIVCKMEWTIQFDYKLALVSDQFFTTQISNYMYQELLFILSLCSSQCQSCSGKTKLPMDPWLHLWICILVLYHCSIYLFKVA